MTPDPFRPPDSNVDVHQPEPGSAVKAVVLGALVDVGGSTIAGMIFFALYGVYLGMNGTSVEDMRSAVGDTPGNSPMAILLNIVGCLFSVLGGYVCARIARHSEYRLGAVLSAVSVILGLLIADNGDPDALAGMYSLFTVASVMVGTHIGATANKRQNR